MKIIRDHDPQPGADRGIRRGSDEISQGQLQQSIQVGIDRQRLANKRTRIDQHVNQDEHSCEQDD
jgi:hypothetical protein